MRSVENTANGTKQRLAEMSRLVSTPFFLRHRSHVGHPVVSLLVTQLRRAPGVLNNAEFQNSDEL